MISVVSAIDDLLRRCKEDGHERTILGIAGAPGAGKSTVCAALLQRAAAAGVAAAAVPMDGWHLAHEVLQQRGLAAVKGAPHTFDAEGFVATLQRIRRQQPGDPSVWVPEFRREVENAVAGALEVRSDVQLVVVEGNYLLLPEQPWATGRRVLDVAWYLRPSDDVRLERLIRRHEQHGRDRLAAIAHATGSDGDNARRIAETSDMTGVLEVDPG